MRDIDYEKLITLAFEARLRAYSPYSGCTVGAALLCSDGRIFTGCNVENAAFGPTICAERTAFVKAISEGAPGDSGSFEAIAVVGGRHDENGELSDYFVPCGVCRQVMAEFCAPSFVIVTARSEADFTVKTLAQLLPDGFSPDKVSVK